MTFQELEHIWEEQTPTKTALSSEKMIDKANSSLARMRRKQHYAIGVLTVTSIILTLFYIGVEAYNHFWTGFGLLVMIFCLLFRIGIEIYQKQKLQNIDPSSDFQSYINDHKTYFQQRKWVHFGLTPVVYLMYFAGFIMMLPAFEAGLSGWFYNYIVISGSILFVVLAGFIGYHIKKEIDELKFFKEMISK